MIFTTKTDNIIIPDEHLRFRVIANSNTLEDQIIKNRVKENVEKEIYTFLRDVDNVDSAKRLIDQNMNNINNIVYDTLRNNNVNYGHKINFGKNHFPRKVFKGIVYEEGKYNSLVVTLGSGKGSNWWCILFPPLCLIEVESNNTNEVEYRFFVRKILDKYFK